ncbi:putative mitochondrial thioredoxin [Leptomonas pyrrhocoris]|uniref:Putative mitochondrial thioredoxin n=1 Tax=Leptomonas pyrrhocoris TaxID=157538 RepID=A0A0N0DWW3_LEPPY|nr:putative mitochondrial thioredoxin [Leptomonas pyrrhocoris]KPA82268.1 putative mitochondrial thioredoxin [Leptomonas pyrrhocoris]|eukprot:XP_015660707.1 putative mitochondrial thioredoxin [Leptomonas pyrrhocoris]
MSSQNPVTAFSLRGGLMGLVVLCLLVSCPAAAFPYGKSSAVTELTPGTLPGFVNTHKPVVILFYAPWCGHCKHFHPEFERFAESVKGTIRVGAIDADQHSSVGQQYGVRGFPTIKYWKMGTKSIASPQDYQGQRTAAALQGFMVADITAAQVKTVSTTEQLKHAAREAPQGRIGVLFSAKEKVPPMLSVMALSPKLKSFPLTFVGGCTLDKGVALSFDVTQLPTLGVLRYTPPAAADGAGEGTFELVPYSKNAIAYEPVAQFFLNCVERECGSGKDSAITASVEGLEEEGEGEDRPHAHLHRQRHDRSHEHHPKHPAMALPVEAVEFTAETMENFCSPRAVKMRGHSPLCVISLTERVNLADVQRQFQSDPLLFFHAAKHRTDVVQQFQATFGVTLSTDATTDSGAVVLLRHGQPTRMRHILLENISSNSDLQQKLQKVLNGELRLDTTHVEGERVQEK